MNSASRKNLVITAMQVGRTMINGPRGALASSRSFASNTSFRSEDGPTNAKEKTDVVETMACIGPNTLPSSNSKVEKNVLKVDPLDVKSNEFLTRFYVSQIKYFKEIAKVNKSAMKRMIKLRKQWLKFMEKHF